MSDQRKIVCPGCEAVNRVPVLRLDGKPNCGKCHRPLFLHKSVVLSAGNFQRHIGSNEIPVLVDFCAEWCGYCKKMAPEFEQAAKRLEPFVRLAKIDTQAFPAIASRYAVTSLPTLILFRGNKEIARQTGALTLAQIDAWTRAQIIS